MTNGVNRKSGRKVSVETGDPTGFKTYEEFKEAVKNLVYDEKKITMEQLVKALDDDFKGHEFIQQLCKDAPKYGNGDDSVDEIIGEMYTFIADEIERYKSKFGTMTPGILPVSGNTPFGLEVGALPYGRNAWKPLADGVSPNGGTDTQGPGAVLKSVSKIPHDRFVQGTLLNMKVEPEMLNSENGIQQQKNPKDYRGLLVRVAGYTAYFTELGKDVQNEIIGRTEQKFLYGCSCG